MSDQLTVTIVGKDGVSRVFAEVSKGAQKTGQTVEAAGKQGARGMNELGKAAEQNASRMERLKAEGAAVGAIFGALAAGAIKAGAAYKDQRLDIQSLESQYGAAADGIIRYTDVLQDSLNTSNDAARDMALTFATLFRNYELGETQIQNLMTRTADIASARGRNAVEVSQMVQNALRGEAEYIEQIGVTLNDTYVASQYAARGLGEWGKVTDEAAKAQFRYVLLMEQTADTQGRAAAEAARAGGQFRHFINEMQDAGTAVGRFLGPVGEVAAEMAPLAIAAPVVGAGIGRLATAARGSTLAMSALGLAVNPLTLGFAALTLAGIGVAKILDNIEKNASGVAEGIALVTAEVERLKLAGQVDIAEELEGTLTKTQELTNLLSGDMEDLVAKGVVPPGTDFLAISTPGGLADQVADAGALYDEFAKTVTKNLDAITDPAAKVAYIQWVNELLDSVKFTVEGTNLDEVLQQAIVTPASEVPGVMAEIGDAAAQAATPVGILTEELRDFVTTLKGLDATANQSFGDRLLNSLGLDFRQQDRVKTTLEDLRQLFTELPDMPGPGASVEEWREWVNVAEQGSVEWNRRRQIATEALAAESAGNEKLAALMARTNDRRDEGTAAMERQARATELATGAAEKHRAALEADRAAMDEWVQVQTDWIAQVLEVAGLDDPLSLWNMAGHADGAMQLANNLGDVAGGMQNTYTAVVGTTDAMGKQIETLDKWALDLIGLRGEWSTLDDLLNEGRISLEKVTAAQAAQEEISAANATVQRDLLAIQAAQAPLLAEGADRYAAYVEQLRALNDGYNDAANGAQQQLSALGFLDEGLASQAMQIAEMAASLDAMGPAGRVAFQGMLEGIIATDPVLTAMLVSMGLVEEKLDASGNKTYTVNLDGADQAMSDIDRLTTAVVALADVFDDGKLNNTITLQTLGLEELDDVKQKLDDIPDKKQTTLDLVLGDSAKGLADYVSGGRTEPLTVPVAFDTQGKSFEDLVAAANNNEPVRVNGQLVIEDAPVLAGDGTGGPVVTVPTQADTTGAEQDLAGLGETVPPVKVPIQFDTGLGADAKGRFAEALGREAAGNVVEVVVNAVDNASGPLGDVKAAVADIDGVSPDVAVAVSGDALAIGQLGAVKNAAEGIPGNVLITISDNGTMQIAFDNLGMVHQQADNIPDTVTIDVSTIGAATAAAMLRDVAFAANSIPRDVTTTVTTRQITEIGVRDLGRVNARHGGIPGYAHGGVVAELAEAGPELLHFATGGVAPVYDRGLYPVPLGTYVSPSNANPGLGGGYSGPPVVVYNYGTIIGVEELKEQIGTDLIYAMADESDRYATAHGRTP